MKTLPSKELLSEAWGSEVTSIEDVRTMWDMKVLPFWAKEKSRVGSFDDRKYHIAIETIAHKCKEWATSKGYVIIQDTRGYTKAYRFPNGEIKFWEDQNMDLTIDRIIQACEWFMEQTK